MGGIGIMEEKIKEILEPFSKKNYFTLTKKIGRRNEFLFSLGESRFLPKEMIWENEQYTLFGEGLEENNKKTLREKIQNL